MGITLRHPLLVLAALLPLASCITVEDFGQYWEKTGMDPQLEGSWKMVAADPEQTADHGYGIGQIMRMVRRGAAYEMAFDGAPDDPPMYPVRTLNVAHYRFLAMRAEGEKGGLIWRYKLQGRVLELCQTDLVDFVERNYPNAVNLRENEGEGSYMNIALFDDHVFTILSKVPDTEQYWFCETKYDRVR